MVSIDEFKVCIEIFEELMDGIEVLLRFILILGVFDLAEIFVVDCFNYVSIFITYDI